MRMVLDRVNENVTSEVVPCFGPVNVLIPGRSRMSGAAIHVQIAPGPDEPDPDDFVPSGKVLRGPGTVPIEFYGDFFLRAQVRNAQPSDDITLLVS